MTHTTQPIKLQVACTHTNTRVFFDGKLVGNIMNRGFRSQDAYMEAAYTEIDRLMKIHTPDAEKFDVMDSEDSFWCKCPGDTLPDSYYVPDGTNADCRKHHYRCNTCHAITQIG